MKRNQEIRAHKTRMPCARDNCPTETPPRKHIIPCARDTQEYNRCMKRNQEIRAHKTRMPCARDNCPSETRMPCARGNCPTKSPRKTKPCAREPREYNLCMKRNQEIRAHKTRMPCARDNCPTKTPPRKHIIPCAR